MTRKILIALCVLFVMPVFAITGCDEVQENLTPKSSFIADFSCEYRKMNITGKLSASGKKLINISLDSPNTVSGLSVTYKGSDLEIPRENMICSADEAYIVNFLIVIYFKFNMAGADTFCFIRHDMFPPV